ncbi:MAG: D-alanine--D-alanine ligase [Nitrospinae bacterium]|nr:D-alanine--D-alanine ligase [Nitrospinota bacterium]
MELLNKKIGVLMGGMSSEREISIKTGMHIYNTLKESGYNAVTIDVGRDIARRLEEEKIDVAFIALHGKYGEDGTVQGLLELMGIPYTGSGVLGSALSMDKAASKEIFERHQISTPVYEVITKKDYEGGYTVMLDLPVVVKPVAGGSTIGVSIVMRADKLDEAIQGAFKHDNSVLIEKFVDGMLLTAGVLGDTALPVVEICPKKGFYDYESKYTAGMTEYFVPARISKKKIEECKRIALKCHRVIRCKGVTRTDMIMDTAQNIFVLEINTIPGMTETSLIPIAAKGVGIEFKDLVLKILEEAVK